MAQEIKNDDTTAWALVVVRNSSGIGVTGLTASDFSSVNVQRDNLAASSLTLTDASGPTDHGAGKLHEVDAGVYKVGIASALLTGFVGNLSITGTYASGAVVPVPNNVVEPERGTDSANTTTPLDAAGIRTAVGLTSANLDTQISAIPTTTLDAAGVRTAVGLASANLDTQLSGIPTTTLDAAGVRTAVGLASANLDTQLAALPTNAPLDAAGIRTAVGLATGNLDTQLSAIPTTTLDAAGVRTAVGLASANLDTQLSAIPTTAPLDAAGTRAALGMSAANLDTQLSTIDTELGQVLDRTGYSLTILAGAISNAGNAAEQYDLTIDTVAHRVLYASLDSSGNRGTTTLSKP